MLVWGGSIRGPAPYYSGGDFKIDITFTSDYPFKAPQVRLLRPQMLKCCDDFARLSVANWHWGIVLLAKDYLLTLRL